MIVQARNDYSLNPGVALDSALTHLRSPHQLKIYPQFGTTSREAHNLVNLGLDVWEADVFKFLDEIMKR
jgi:hypothetical protein